MSGRLRISGAVITALVACCICGCSGGSDRPIDFSSQEELISQLKGLNASMRYDDVVRIFGKPCEEFNPASNPDEEYVLYYRCRDDAARGFWIMLHYPEKTFWYSSDGVVNLGEPRGGNRLVGALYAKGAKPSTTGKIILQGADSGFGSDIKVAITDPEVINRVWTAILNSQNYGVYSACGYRKIEFHSSIDSDTPLATLTVLCENGAAYLEEQQRARRTGHAGPFSDGR